MLSHGYIKNDFDVKRRAALKFPEEAAKELVKERWHKVTREKLSMPKPRLGQSGGSSAKGVRLRLREPQEEQKVTTQFL